MKLYLVHCGFYDAEVGDGVFKFHSNFLVVAEDFDSARIKAKALAEYQRKKMHIDGLQAIDAVEGYRILPQLDVALSGQTVVKSHRHRELSSAQRQTGLGGET